MRVGQPKRREENEYHITQGTPLFLFFSPPLSLPCVNWATREGCLFHLRSSLSPGPSFVLFSWSFPFFVSQPLPFWTPFSQSNYLTILSRSLCYLPMPWTLQNVASHITNVGFFSPTHQHEVLITTEVTSMKTLRKQGEINRSYPDGIQMKMA